MKNKLQKNSGLNKSFWLEKRICFRGIDNARDVANEHEKKREKAMSIIDGYVEQVGDEELNILKLEQRIQKPKEGDDVELLIQARIKLLEYVENQLSPKDRRKFNEALIDMKGVVDDTQKDLLKLAEKTDFKNKKVTLDQSIISGFKGVRGEQLDNSRFERLDGARGGIGDALRGLGVLNPDTGKFLRNLLTGFWGVHREVTYKDIINAIVNLPQNEIAQKINEAYLEGDIGGALNVYKTELVIGIDKLAQAIKDLRFSEAALAQKGNNRLAVAGRLGEKLPEHEFNLRKLCNFDDDDDLEAGITKSSNFDKVDEGKSIRINIMGDIGIDEIQLYDQIRTVCLDEKGEFSEAKFQALLTLADKKGREYADYMKAYSEKDGTADALVRDIEAKIKNAKGQEKKNLENQKWMIRKKENAYEKELKKLKEYKTKFQWGKGEQAEEIYSFKIKYVIFGLKALYEGRKFSDTDKREGDFSLASQRPLAENEEVRTALSNAEISVMGFYDAVQRGSVDVYLDANKVTPEKKAEIKEKLRSAKTLLAEIKKDFEAKGGKLSQEVESKVLYHIMVYGQLRTTEVNDQSGTNQGEVKSLLTVASFNRAFDLGHGFVLFLGAGFKTDGIIDREGSSAAKEAVSSNGDIVTPFVSGGLGWRIVNKEHFKLDLAATGATSTFGAATIAAHYNSGDSREWGAFLGGGISTLGPVAFVGFERDPVRSLWNKVAKRISDPNKRITAIFDGRTLNIDPGNASPAELRERIRIAVDENSPGFFSGVGAAWLDGMIVPFVRLSFSAGTRHHTKGYSAELLDKEVQLTQQIAILNKIVDDEKITVGTGRKVEKTRSFITVPTKDGNVDMDFELDETDSSYSPPQGVDQKSLNTVDLIRLYKQPFQRLGWRAELIKEDKRMYLSIAPRTNEAKDTRIMFTGKFANFAERAHFVKEPNLMLDLGDFEADFAKMARNAPNVRVANLSAHTGRSERMVIISDRETEIGFDEVKKSVDESAYSFYVQHQDQRVVRVNNYASGRGKDGQAIMEPSGTLGDPFNFEGIKQGVLPVSPEGAMNYELTDHQVGLAEELATEIDDNRKDRTKNLFTNIMDYGVTNVSFATIKDQILRLVGRDLSLGEKEYLFVRRVINEVYARNATKSDRVFDSTGKLKEGRITGPNGMIKDTEDLLQSQMRYSPALAKGLSSEMRELFKTFKDIPRLDYDSDNVTVGNYAPLMAGSSAIMLSKRYDRDAKSRALALRRFTAFKDEVPTFTRRLEDHSDTLRLYVEQNKEEIKARIKSAIEKSINMWVMRLGLTQVNKNEITSKIDGTVGQVIERLKNNQKINFELFSIGADNDPARKSINIGFDLNAVVGFSYGVRDDQFQCFNPIIAHGLQFEEKTTAQEVSKFLTLKGAYAETSIMNDPLKVGKNIWSIWFGGATREDEVRIRVEKCGSVAGGEQNNEGTTGGGEQGGLNDGGSTTTDPDETGGSYDNPFNSLNPGGSTTTLPDQTGGSYSPPWKS